MSIIIKGLSHYYNKGTPFETTALENINLTIQKGEFVGIIGHTGSGKSTLIQMFNGLLKPTAGTVLIEGKDIHESKASKKAIRQKVGLIFQYPEYQLFETTVYKDVAFGPKNMGIEGEELKMRVEEALQVVGLNKDYYEKSPFELSGGQKRRVAIAGVLAMKPDILILDEPTAGLDPKGREELFLQLEGMHKTLGLTIVLISHSMEDVAKHTSRLVVLHEGSIVFDDVPKEVFKHIEKLESIGLAPPQISYITRELREKGIPLESGLLTVEDAAKAIATYLKSKQQRNIQDNLSNTDGSKVQGGEETC
jgi:energy-coupling factor transport system ATP-binding protein